MFYDMFVKLCKENNEKPTPVLKRLGLSPGNLDKWKNGATVNSEVLLKLSEHFGVSTDYLLKGIEAEKSPGSGLTEDEERVLGYYKQLSDEKHKDYIKGELARLLMAEESNKKDVEFAEELGE